MKKNLIVILGPTASGKTRLAVQLARELASEIISADSRQVYKGMDIGTGKDLQEYTLAGKQIAYHLIDIVSAAEEFNLFEFQRRFNEIYLQLVERKIVPILVGGTGLYLESIIVGYYLPAAPPNLVSRKSLEKKPIDELREILLACGKRMHNKTDLESKDRLIRAIEIEKAREEQKDAIPAMVKIDAAVFGIRWSRSVLRSRITERLRQRLEEGMIDEVSALHKSGLTWERLESFGLEYRFIAQYLQNKINYDEMFGKLNTGIHQFAKRQETWFRRMEKKGIVINWIDGDNFNLLKESVAGYSYNG